MLNEGLIPDVTWNNLVDELNFLNLLEGVSANKQNNLFATGKSQSNMSAIKHTIDDKCWENCSLNLRETK